MDKWFDVRFKGRDWTLKEYEDGLVAVTDGIELKLAQNVLTLKNDGETSTYHRLMAGLDLETNEGNIVFFKDHETGDVAKMTFLAGGAA